MSFDRPLPPTTTERGIRVALIFALAAERLTLYYEHGKWLTDAQATSLAADWLGRSKRQLAVEERRRLAALSDKLARQIEGSVSREAGLFTYAKPSYACLATRVPTGRRIEAGALGRIEAAESALRALGYDDLRVRLCEGGVRLELPESELERAVRGRGEILRALDGMGRVTLDLRGR